MRSTIDVDEVADLELGGRPGDGEFLERHAPFGLEADIDDGEIILDRDDAALGHGAVEAGGALQRFLEQCCEILFAGRIAAGESRMPFG